MSHEIPCIDPRVASSTGLPWPKPVSAPVEETAEESDDDSEEKDSSPQPSVPRPSVAINTSATNKRKRDVFYGLNKSTPNIVPGSSLSFQLSATLDKADFQNLIDLGVDRALEDSARAATC
mmetsp:Transcript_25943/g.42574  ORF Transcript_25943/g.42574 Transcript_25943/m.42574 type:complete len:121 (+) Transcript_25943:180-542(+)